MDPLANPEFREPGLLEKLREAVFGIPRPLACAQIEVTSACAGECSYCPRCAQKESWRSRHMRAETFASLWPVLRRAARAHLQGWGEPLLHPRFFDFQALAARAGCLTSTTSSGIVMDDETAARIAASGMDIIAFSLAGTDAESNSARKNVPFAQVMASIRKVREAVKKGGHSLEIHIAYLLLADRMEAVERLPDLMEEYEVDMAVISTLDYLPTKGHKALAFGPEETDKIRQARELAQKAAEKAEKSDRFIVYSLPGPQPVKGGCRENAARNIYIDADGNLSPCVYLNVPGNDGQERRRVFGNSLQDDAWELWQKEDFRNFRAKCLTPEPDIVCAACPKRWESEN